MKAKYSLILLGLCAVVGFTGSQTHAQSPVFNVLYTFSFPTLYTNADGASPSAGLLLSGGTLFGTTYAEGAGGGGTIFRINPDGSHFTNLHNFTATNHDPGNPSARLILDGNRLYGTGYLGPYTNSGGIFAINTDGTGYSNLYLFSALKYGSNGEYAESNFDGAEPVCDLALFDGILYGAATQGGSSGQGTLFKLGTNGENFSVMHTFSSLSGPNETNSDGAYPGGMVLAAGKLYGTARYAGLGSGVLFSIETNASNFSVLHYFSPLPEMYSGTNGDGAFPNPELTLAGNALYGLTAFGGAYGSGTIFKIGLDGSNFTNLYNFAPENSSIPASAAGEYATGLFVSGNQIYGTTTSGSGNLNGTIFSLNLDGSGFSNLYTFCASSPPGYDNEYIGTNADGSEPGGSVIYSGGTLYGTASYGGLNGSGTIYALQLAPTLPSLSITVTSQQFTVNWPLTASNFTLQTTTDLFAANWNSITSGIVTAGTNLTFTSPIYGRAAFFRLRSN